MAKKDFAHIKAPSRQEKKAGLNMLPFAIVAIAGFCFAAGYWTGTAQHDVKPTVSQKDMAARQARLDAKTAEINVLQARIDALEEQVAMWKGKAKQDAHSKVGDLQFYTDLPKQSVTPAPVVEPAKESGEPVEPSPVKADPHEFASSGQGVVTPVAAEPRAVLAGFRIQIASFRSRVDATALQNKLNKAGFKAYVQTVDLAERGQWFRTYAGPYASKAEAEQRLPAIEAQMHMKGLLIRGG
ncbi:SPOR domain-containing protein [Mariprofundus ferrooxydans]|uniref:SPOR domain-containing protein n=1 Tax=Mariprofundus ferrooxydans PV-1 TaxID=314345 RepID=Q0EWE5_9PROT|nr:SPOR domain-containing protein [Mariprofundus ferrooxydans]EAU53634.1 hypothetical protein SPV1_13582 [Mariprofundus ferrooxydans PV-1]KON46464.1 hypothetical protein AL013_13135 [Mariprofundus ferrooxydans]